MEPRSSAGESTRKQEDICGWLVPELNSVGELGRYDSEDSSR